MTSNESTQQPRRAVLVIEYSPDAGIGHRGGVDGFLMRKAEQIVRELVDRSDTCAVAHVHLLTDHE